MIRESLVFVSFVIGLSTGYLDCPKQSYESACTLGGTFTLPTTPAPANAAPVCDELVVRAYLAKEPLPIIYAEAVADQTYTIVILDADYKRVNSKGVYNLLYVLANVPGDPLNAAGASATDGTVLASWRAPSAIYNPGVHRVIILVFRHKSPETRVSAPINDSIRAHFVLSSWLYRNRDALDCIPVAGFQLRVHTN